MEQKNTRKLFTIARKLLQQQIELNIILQNDRALTSVDKELLEFSLVDLKESIDKIGTLIKNQIS